MLKQMSLENTMLNEGNQPNFVWFHLFEIPLMGKSIETESQLARKERNETDSY